MTTKKWSQPKGDKRMTHVVRYVGFKSNKEMQDYVKTHSIKTTGSGYSEDYGHFFECDE